MYGFSREDVGRSADSSITFQQRTLTICSGPSDGLPETNSKEIPAKPSESPKILALKGRECGLFNAQTFKNGDTYQMRKRPGTCGSQPLQKDKISVNISTKVLMNYKMPTHQTTV